MIVQSLNDHLGGHGFLALDELGTWSGTMIQLFATRTHFCLSGYVHTATGTGATVRSPKTDLIDSLTVPSAFLRGLYGDYTPNLLKAPHRVRGCNMFLHSALNLIEGSSNYDSGSLRI